MYNKLDWNLVHKLFYSEKCKISANIFYPYSAQNLKEICCKLQFGFAEVFLTDCLCVTSISIS